MGDTSTNLRNNIAGHKQCRRILESISDNLLIQAIEKPVRRDALLTLTKKEGLTGDVKAEGSLGCSDHEIVEFRIVRGWSRVKSKITVLDFRRADFGLFRYLLGRVPLDKALEGRGTQES